MIDKIIRKLERVKGLGRDLREGNLEELEGGNGGGK